MSRYIQLEDIRTPPETAPPPAATPSLDRARSVLDRSGRPLPGDPIDVLGFVRPRELRHDASLYRVVAAERKKIEFAGGKITRVILDHEFKKQLYTNSEEANTLQLTVLNGHVQLPDARVGYENAAGEHAQI